jgi:hypothetical protein
LLRVCHWARASEQPESQPARGAGGAENLPSVPGAPREGGNAPAEIPPKESLKLQNNGTLSQVLDQRTLSAWNTLRDCRANAMNQNEAEEVALPTILPPSEQEEEMRTSKEPIGDE